MVFKNYTATNNNSLNIKKTSICNFKNYDIYNSSQLEDQWVLNCYLDICESKSDVDVYKILMINYMLFGLNLIILNNNCTYNLTVKYKLYENYFF